GDHPRRADGLDGTARLRRGEAQVQVGGATRAAEDEPETATAVQANRCRYVDGKVGSIDALKSPGRSGGIVGGAGHCKDVREDEPGGVAERRREVDVAAPLDAGLPGEAGR